MPLRPSGEGSEPADASAVVAAATIAALAAHNGLPALEGALADKAGSAPRGAAPHCARVATGTGNRAPVAALTRGRIL